MSSAQGLGPKSAPTLGEQPAHRADGKGAQQRARTARDRRAVELRDAGFEEIRETQRPQKQKRRSLEEEAAFCLIVTRKEELLCPWQVWQRPTLPGLKP